MTPQTQTDVSIKITYGEKTRTLVLAVATHGVELDGTNAVGVTLVLDGEPNSPDESTPEVGAQGDVTFDKQSDTSEFKTAPKPIAFDENSVQIEDPYKTMIISLTPTNFKITNGTDVLVDIPATEFFTLIPAVKTIIVKDADLKALVQDGWTDRSFEIKFVDGSDAPHTLAMSSFKPIGAEADNNVLLVQYSPGSVTFDGVDCASGTAGTIKTDALDFTPVPAMVMLARVDATKQEYVNNVAVNIRASLSATELKFTVDGKTKSVNIPADNALSTYVTSTLKDVDSVSFYTKLDTQQLSGLVTDTKTERGFGDKALKVAEAGSGYIHIKCYPRFKGMPKDPKGNTVDIKELDKIPEYKTTIATIDIDEKGAVKFNKELVGTLATASTPTKGGGGDPLRRTSTTHRTHRISSSDKTRVAAKVLANLASQTRGRRRAPV